MSEVPANPATLVADARAARGRGDLATALALFRQALALNPGKRDVAVEVADALRALGELDESDAVLRELLATHPDMIPARMGLGRNARRRGDHAGALDHFREALALKPDHAAAFDEMIRELQALGRAQEENALLAEAVRTGRATALAYQRLGQEAAARHDEQQALACFEEGIRLQPAHAGCHAGFIQECLRIHQLDRAASALARARASLPQPAAPVEIAGLRLLVAQGQLDTALTQARALREQFPGVAQVLHVLADLCMRTADFAAADEAIAALPADLPGQQAQQLLARARLARARYDFEEGIRLVAEARALAPDHPGSLQLLLMLHQSNSDPQAARDAIAAQQALAGAGSPGAEVPRLRQGLQKELEVNPFARQAVAAAGALPLAERPAALAAALQDEPHYFGSALALLVSLNRLGAWARPTPRPDAGRTSRIPRRVVQFWDSAEIPDDILSAMQSWPRRCLGFEHQVFNDHSASALLAAECAPEVLRAFRTANQPAMRADVFRLAYLSVRGGIYADADDLCRHNVQPWLVPGIDLLLLQEDIGTIGNNFLAAAPGHPFIVATLAAVVRNILERQGDDIWFTSGPGTLTQQFCQQYLDDLGAGQLPAGIAVRDCYHLQQRITQHLPRSYKQDERYWLSRKAEKIPLFRATLVAGEPVRLRRLLATESGGPAPADAGPAPGGTTIAAGAPGGNLSSTSGPASSPA